MALDAKFIFFFSFCEFASHPFAKQPLCRVTITTHAILVLLPHSEKKREFNSHLENISIFNLKSKVPSIESVDLTEIFAQKKIVKVNFCNFRTVLPPSERFPLRSSG